MWTIVVQFALKASIPVRSSSAAVVTRYVPNSDGTARRPRQCRLTVDALDKTWMRRTRTGLKQTKQRRPTGIADPTHAEH